MKEYECYFDGACEPKNPGGKIGAGVYITDGKNIYESNLFKEANVNNTNNIAEYMAFIKVLKLMEVKSDCRIEIYGDSMLVVNQMNNEWQIKHGAYRPFAIQAKELLSILKQRNEVIISWIPREQNEKADYQSIKALGFERRKWR